MVIESALSTSRINRLLRPLRTKCTTLASLHPSVNHYASLYTTYSSKGASFQSEIPPLSLPHPPRLSAENCGLASLRSSIYAVRDCFKEIVVKSDGSRTQKLTPTSNVMSLTSLCAIIIGENLESEIDADATEAERDEQLASIYAIYEAVPLQSRR